MTVQRTGTTVIAVIFEAVPRDDCAREYLSVTADAWPLLDKVDGCLGMERFESLSDPGKLVAISFWRDETALRIWQNVEPQAATCHAALRKFRIRIAKVIFDSAAVPNPRDLTDGPKLACEMNAFSAFAAGVPHAHANSADIAP